MSLYIFTLNVLSQVFLHLEMRTLLPCLSHRTIPSIYKGVCVNVKKSPTGQIYTTFNCPHFTSDFTFRDFCYEAAKELLSSIVSHLSSLMS